MTACTHHAVANRSEFRRLGMNQCSFLYPMKTPLKKRVRFWITEEWENFKDWTWILPFITLGFTGLCLWGLGLAGQQIWNIMPYFLKQLTKGTALFLMVFLFQAGCIWFYKEDSLCQLSTDAQRYRGFKAAIKVCTWSGIIAVIIWRLRTE